MIDRAMLHQIIDAVPDESLANIERVLQYEGLVASGVGRIPEETAQEIRRNLKQQLNAPDDWNSLRVKMRQGDQRHARHIREMSGGLSTGREQQDGSRSSVQGFDKDGALIVLTFRYLKGHKVETAERISFSPEAHSLTYSLDVVGPDGGHSHHDAQFSASAA